MRRMGLAGALVLSVGTANAAGSVVVFSQTGIVGDDDWTVAGTHDFELHPSSLGIVTPPITIPPGQQYYDSYAISTYLITLTSKSNVVEDDSFFYQWEQGFGYRYNGPDVTLIDGADCIFCPGVQTAKAYGNSYVEEFRPITESRSTFQYLPEIGPGAYEIDGYTNMADSFDFDVTVDGAGAGLPYSLTVSLLPEPSSWLILMLGMFGIGTAMRSRRAVSKPGHGFGAIDQILASTANLLAKSVAPPWA